MVTLASKVLTWRFPEGRRRELIDPYVHLSKRPSTSNRHTQVLFSGHSKLQAYIACSMAEYTLQAFRDWRQELSGNEAGVVWERGRIILPCIRIPFFPDSLCTSILWSMNISLCSILCDFSPFRDILTLNILTRT